MSDKKISTKININKDDSSLNDFLFLWSEFGTRPNKIFLHGEFSKDLLSQIDGFDNVNVFQEISFEPDSDIQNDKSMSKISNSIYLSYVILDKLVDSVLTDLTIYYKSNSDLESCQLLVEQFSEFILEKSNLENSNFWIASLSQSGLEMVNLSNETKSKDIQLYYQKNTWKQSKKVIKRLQKSENGLVIFVGERGCGKSSFIKYLATQVDRDVIYLPNTMVDLCLNSSDFRKILHKFNKPIVVLDDCETIFSETVHRNNLVCNNLIQLIDGVSPVDNLSILAIFNTEDEEEIDHNLLDSNSLFEIVEFNRLGLDESQSLSKILKTKNKFTKDCRLVDVIRDKTPEDKGKLGF